MTRRRGAVLVAGMALLLALVAGLFSDKSLDYLVYPQGEYSQIAAPPAPDYSDQGNWAALPDRRDGADTLPPNTGARDGQDRAQADVFSLYPTSYFLSGGWNATTDNSLANLVTDHGVLPQQASAFNAVARIYAPRYRQASQGAQMQSKDPVSKRQALDLAFSDTVRAFDYFLEHHNRGRPFFIASHSQGTTHGKELLKYLFREHPEAARRLIAAYLVGNTVMADELSPLLPVCASPEQTGCLLSWNTVLRGGGGSHWRAGGNPVCVNPLSWRFDEQYADASINLGAIPITGMRFITSPHQGLTGAQCADGILWIDLPAQAGYDMALFPGGSYHAYDYNLFYMNIRDNARQRAEAYLTRSANSSP